MRDPDRHNDFLIINHGQKKIIDKTKPSEWAENVRVMGTESTNFPGKFSYDRTPYLREPVDCLAPDHPAREIAVMKGAQIGFSTGVIENGLGYLIAHDPCNILLAARDGDLVKDMVEKKIDPMPDSTGLRLKLQALSKKARQQRTGDTSFTKEFSGGSIRTFSIQKPGRMRQVSVKVGFLDDFEAAPVDPNAGDAAALFRTRFKSYGDSKKIFWISTPEIKHTSNIEPLYLRGDQRRYHVPCPKCGQYIVLEWKTKTAEGRHAGIVYETDEDGVLIPGSVMYKCQKCLQTFSESHKYEMNLAGKWIPTARPKEEGFYSYQISALYAPPGMDDWPVYVNDYLKACPPGGIINLDKYKTFVQTGLGLTWEERGKTLNVTRLARNTRQYSRGCVPRDLSINEGNGEIMMVTMGVDLNGTEEDARIDWEIVAWSKEGPSYSVDHGSIGTFVARENTLKTKKDREKWTYFTYGERNVWDVLLEIVTAPLPDDQGLDDQYRIGALAIDSGFLPNTVYDFIEKINQVYGIFSIAIKGQGAEDFRRNNADTKIFKESRERSDMFWIHVNQIKDEISEVMNFKWSVDDGALQPQGFMNFPAPDGEHYTMESFFSHFQSERRITKDNAQGKSAGYMWEKKNSNVVNHHWDTRIYNVAVKEIATFQTCKQLGLKPENWYSFCKYFTS